jgi:N-methylhydantoinase A/oxoprolinase/acetone carboxylase beta subunit
VIEEITTTLVIEPNWQAELHESGVYLVDMIGA